MNEVTIGTRSHTLGRQYDPIGWGIRSYSEAYRS